MNLRTFMCAGALLALLFAPPRLQAHGGVMAQADLCVIKIGVYRAHFTLYQPDSRGSQEFCEDVPDVSRTVIVMDYQHPSMREVPVSLRIIRDVTGRTIYANESDIEKIPDLDRVTVFYHPPKVESAGTFSAEYRFTEPGWYIGVVTAGHPTLDKTYRAVFGFHVGRRWGFWPWVVLALIAVQAQYWFFGGGFARWRKARRKTDHET